MLFPGVDEFMGVLPGVGRVFAYIINRREDETAACPQDAQGLEHCGFGLCFAALFNSQGAAHASPYAFILGFEFLFYLLQIGALSFPGIEPDQDVDACVQNIVKYGHKGAGDDIGILLPGLVDQLGFFLERMGQ